MENSLRNKLEQISGIRIPETLKLHSYQPPERKLYSKDQTPGTIQFQGGIVDHVVIVLHADDKNFWDLASLEFSRRFPEIDI